MHYTRNSPFVSFFLNKHMQMEFIWMIMKLSLIWYMIRENDFNKKIYDPLKFYVNFMRMKFLITKLL